MTRLSAHKKRYRIENMTGEHGNIMQLIDEIFDDFENRSCDGCKFKDTAPTEDPCAICSRLHEDQFEPKEQ